VIASIVASLFLGLNLGIDFTGGSLLELEFSIARPTPQQVTEALSPLELGSVVAQPIGERGMTLRFKNTDEPTHQQIIETLKQTFKQTGQLETDSELQITYEARVLEEKRFDSIGPTIGQELKRKTVWAIAIVLAAIVVYIAWAFRKVSKPIASWKYGLIATIALFHDIMITIGVFAVLGKVYGLEINATFVAALLTILGYSVNDTIVVFDRIRENLIRQIGEDFEKIVQTSINQVITRSINASFTTLLALFAVLLFGGPTVRDFILALIIGISVGTYSSIFLASPMLVAWEKLRLNR